MSYNLDTTGSSPSNLVVAEIQPINPSILSNFGYIVLKNSPFFGNNLSVSYTDSNGVISSLTMGVDYSPIFSIPGIGNSIATKIWGGIVFYNTSLNGSVSVTYQALGGSWVINATEINQYLSANPYNANTQLISLIPSPALYLPNNPSVAWPITSITGLVIAQSQVINISLGVAYTQKDATYNGTSIGLANSILGGNTDQLVYQKSPNQTGFVPAPGAYNELLSYDANGYYWTNLNTLATEISTIIGYTGGGGSGGSSVTLSDTEPTVTYPGMIWVSP